jgi:hypothetical protein
VLKLQGYYQVVFQTFLLCSDDLEDKFFWPFAETAAASYDVVDDDREREHSEHYERNNYGERWPVCYGRCSGGTCKLDQSKPGCCCSRGGRRGYAGSAELARHAETYAAADLVCWEGYGDGGY